MIWYLTTGNHCLLTPKHVARSLQDLSNVEAADLHWTWNVCNDAYWSDEDNVCSQELKGIEGYHFLHVKEYNATAEGGTCFEPTANKVATVTCDIDGTDTLVIPVINGFWTPDYEGQTYAEARNFANEFFRTEFKVFDATLDGASVPVEYLISGDWNTLDVSQEGCSDSQILDGLKFLSVGYWVILSDLSTGEHTIYVSGGMDPNGACSIGTVEVTVTATCNLACALSKIPIIGWIFAFLFGS